MGGSKGRQRRASNKHWEAGQMAKAVTAWGEIRDDSSEESKGGERR